MLSINLSPPEPSQVSPPKADPSSLVSALRDDWGLNHLLQALALGEGFHFHLLISDTPRIAQAAFRLIRESLAQTLLIIEPERKKGVASKPLRFDDLATLLRQLMDLLKEGRGLTRTLLIDASTASPKDEPAWREFFRRLNERRNILTLDWRGPFILCVPPLLEVSFAHEAPDFWSIRSTSITLSYRTAINQEISPPSRGGDEARTISVNPQQAYSETTPSRQRVEESSDNLAALTSQAILLGRLGSSLAEQRKWSQASHAYGKALEAWQHVVQKSPKSFEGLFSIAGILADLGEVGLAEGDLGGARSKYEEAVEILKRLGEKDSVEEVSSALAAALVRLGDIQRRQGKPSDAQALYEQALDNIRRSLNLDPQRPEWLRNLSRALERIGDAQNDLGNPLEAESLYQESLAIMRRLVVVDPSRARWLQDLAAILAKVGDARGVVGDIESALRAYEESLSIMREIIGRNSGKPEPTHNLVVLLDRIGNLERARGDFSRARALYEEATGVFSSLLETESDRSRWIRDFVAILMHKGDVQKEQGAFGEAQASYEDSLALVRNGLKREPDNPDWPFDQAWVMMKLGDVRKERGDLTGARLSYEEALRAVHEISARFPEHHSAQALSAALANAIDGIRDAQSGRD